MEEMEVPTESLHEQINEAAHKGKDRWTMIVAISTGIMASFAAISSLLAGHHSNEAMISQIKSSDQWALYQAKGIKAEINNSILLLSADKKAEDLDVVKEKVNRYKEEQEGIKEKATEFEKESAGHLAKDMVLARCVTLFQVAIALSAISILTKKRLLWIFSMALAGIGIFELIVALL